MDQAVMKNALTISKPSIKFWAFKYYSGISATSARVFGFKEETKITRDSHSREGWASAVVLGTNLGIFICSQTTEVNMSKQNCSFCPHNDHPIDQLSKGFTLINFAVEGTEQLIQADYSGINPQHAFALSLSWHAFREALKTYVESKGDDFSLIAGGDK